MPEVMPLYRLVFESTTCPTCGTLLLTQRYEENKWIFYCTTCERYVHG